MNLLQNKCKHCGKQAARLLLFAAMKDAGARGYDPLKCDESDNGHDFCDEVKPMIGDKVDLEDGEADLPTISERSIIRAPTPEPKAKWEKDGTHGLIIGGPFDNTVELDEALLKDGFVRANNMRWHEYRVHDRGDGTKFFLYSGSRERLNR